ncbi:c-type cytochrome [Polaromonas sp.]|uniref:c-type cytochrome n=1 Tax=Polaromonas sp. TaxID=1869339 RepID=UPI003262DABF
MFAAGRCSAADPARGARIYAERCIACHSIDVNRTGPAHCGLFARISGTAPGFKNYSRPMRDARIRWSEATLLVFLKSPTTAVPGTSMTYNGIADAGERADLAAWLKQATSAQKCALKTGDGS